MSTHPGRALCLCEVTHGAGVPGPLPRGCREENLAALFLSPRLQLLNCPDVRGESHSQLSPHHPESTLAAHSFKSYAPIRHPGVQEHRDGGGGRGRDRHTRSLQDNEGCCIGDTRVKLDWSPLVEAHG
jgi:hypothetical protein